MIVASILDVGKVYKSYSSEWHRFARWFGLRIGPPVEENWVLSGVNFQINQGEAIGIIGKNGAGKSTLLKILAGVLEPSSGSIEINGKISAILELGLGFNDELTGLQNVRFSLEQMGLVRVSETIRRIEEFADIGEHFYKPVRTYSSGMRARVSFSLSAIIKPDILIADEVLAVGDIFFQQKCIERMKELKQNGTSIIYVSHDINSVHEICDKALVLDKHKQIFLGSTQEASEIYHALNTEIENDQQVKDSKQVGKNENQPTLSRDHKSVSKSAENLKNSLLNYVVSACFVGENGEEIIDLQEMECYGLKIICQNLNGYKDPHIGFRIQNYIGTVVYETNTYCQKFFPSEQIEDGQVTLIFTIPRLSLAEGEYSLSIGIDDEGYGQELFKNTISPPATLFTFYVRRQLNSKRWVGIANLDVQVNAHD
jgi:lipopolysaccharide transport system ATP-binding protein